MIKLKKIILQLEEEVYQALEQDLERTKAGNFLHLLRAYRNGNDSDAEIAKHLGISSNSLYVLKSRLNDKIQQNLSGDIFAEQGEVLKHLHRIPEILYSSPREVAESFLQKLELDLLRFDMHNELLAVYSALKKINLFSEKYFHYSQQFNKHAAFNLSLEKSEEILGNFNRSLGQYDFSRSPDLLDRLMFLNKEVNHHFHLNPSRQTEIIRNFMGLQLAIFYSVFPGNAFNAEEVLQQTEKLIDQLPPGSMQKSWKKPLNYLFFDFYRKTGRHTAAQDYFKLVDADLDNILLFTPLALTSRFLISRLNFEQVQQDSLKRADQILRNSEDTHSTVLLALYKAMLLFRNGTFKEAASALNDILNSTSFKDYFHINLEVRLTLAYFYMKMGEADLAENLLKNLARKIKAEEVERYGHVLNLIKVLTAELKQPKGPPPAKLKDEFVLFKARNINEKEILSHLIGPLSERYA